MRVAQIISSASFAGAEAVACSLAQALTDSVELSALYLVLEMRAGQDACLALADRASEFAIPIRRFETYARFSPELVAEIGRELAADGIDVIHNHSYKTATLAPLIRKVGRSSHNASLFTVHGFDQSDLSGALFLHSVNAASAYVSDHIITVSPPLEEYYRRLPGLDKKVSTIPNALVSPNGEDEDQSAANRSRARSDIRRQLASSYGVPNDALWVACVGRLVPVKNHDLFLQCAMNHDQADRRVHFWIVGDGPLRESLEQEAYRRGIADRITFTGNVDAVDDIYQAIDMLMLTSHSEGSPMVVLEALGHGVPILASRVGGVPELIETEKQGLLFDVNNTNDCFSKFDRLVQSSALREKLGKAARTRAEGPLHWRRWADRHMSLYEKALGQKRLR